MSELRRSSPAVRTLVAATLLAGSSAALADGVTFDGDLPTAPHVTLELTAAQRRDLARAALAPSPPELALTPPQQQVLQKATGARVPWVFAATKEQLAGDCTCGAYNLAVVVGTTRLAVLRYDLGDHVRPSELAALDSSLRDPALPSGGAIPLSGMGADVRPAAARFLGTVFSTSVSLGEGWTAQRLRVAAVPHVDYAGQPVVELATPASIALRPSAARTLHWPDVGARRVDGTRTTVIVPGFREAELGPAGRAWFVLSYEGDRLAGVDVIEEGAGRSSWAPAATP